MGKQIEVQKLQQSCLKNVRHQQYRLGNIKESLRKYKCKASLTSAAAVLFCRIGGVQQLKDEQGACKLRDLVMQMADVKARLMSMTEELPRESNG